MDYYRSTHGKIAYRYENSNKNRPLIVFLSGLGGDSTYLEFKNFGAQISSDFPKLYVDILGNGYSSDTEYDRTVENISDELHQLLNTIDNDRIIFLCHSFSAVYAWNYSFRYQNEVAGLILIEPTTLESEWLYSNDPTYLKAAEEFKSLPESAFKDPEWTPEYEKQILDHSKPYVEGTSLFDEVARSDDNLKTSKDIHLPNLPVLIIALPYREAEYIRSTYNTEKMSFKAFDGNHFLHLVHRDRVAKSINDWLSDTFTDTAN
jgi:pimeloyl-ACP methyl ester carboxylesterase